MEDPIKNVGVSPTVSKGEVFSTFVLELVDLSRELTARRQFDEEVSVWLKQSGLRTAFEEFRNKRRAESAVPPNVQTEK